MVATVFFLHKTLFNQFSCFGHFESHVSQGSFIYLIESSHKIQYSGGKFRLIDSALVLALAKAALSMPDQAISLHNYNLKYLAQHVLASSSAFPPNY
jgi:hypothetical protein